MHKRIVPLLIVLSIAVSALTAFAAGWEQVQYADREYACGLLAAMGMLPADKNGQVDQNAAVNRAELADAVLHLTGAYDSAVYAPMFDDVKEDAEYARAICSLAQMGIIDGVSERNYWPAETAVYEQAVKMIINLLGYDKFAQVQSGYPSGYLQVAEDIGLTKNISVPPGMQLNRGMLAALMFNALDCRMAETDFIEKYYQGEKTLLEKNLDMAKAEGVLTDNGVTTLTGQSKLGKGNIMVAGTRIADETGAADGLLGYDVVVYYQINGGDHTAVYAYATKKNSRIRIAAKDVKKDDARFSFTDYYYYDENGKTKSVKIDEEADLIYNGVADPAFTLETMQPAAGSITFLDNDNDAVAEVMLVEEIDNYIVSTVNTQAPCIYDKYDKILDLEDTETVIVKSMYGEDMALAQLKEWDVLSVAASKNMDYVQIVVVNDPVTGVVEKIYEEDGYTYVTIDGDTFAIAKSYQDAAGAGHINTKEIVVGQRGVYYLDITECIAAVVLDADAAWTYAYMISAKLTEEDHVRVKLIKDESGARNYNLGEKVRIDGIKCDEPEAYERLLIDDTGAAGPEFTPRLVRFRLDGTGTVAGIDTMLNGPSETEENLQNDVPKTKEYWSVRTGRFGAGESVGVMVAPSTRVFKVPTADILNEEKYAASYSFRHNYEYTYEAYDVDFSGAAGAVVVYVDEASEDTMYATAMLVEDVVTKLNGEDEVVSVIQGYGYDGTYKEFEPENEGGFDGVAFGDIITYHVNYQNKMYGIEMQYDLSENDGYTTTAQVFHATGDYTAAYESNAQTYLIRNIIVEKQGGYIHCLVPGMDITSFKKNQLSFADKQIYSTTDATVFQINQARKRIEKIPAEDLEDYVYARNHDVRVLLLATYTQLRGIYVYA